MTGFGTNASVTAAMAVRRIEKDVQQQVRSQTTFHNIHHVTP